MSEKARWLLPSTVELLIVSESFQALQRARLSKDQRGICMDIYSPSNIHKMYFMIKLLNHFIVWIFRKDAKYAIIQILYFPVS